MSRRLTPHPRSWLPSNDLRSFGFTWTRAGRWIDCATQRSYLTEEAWPIVYERVREKGSEFAAMCAAGAAWYEMGMPSNEKPNAKTNDGELAEVALQRLAERIARRLELGWWMGVVPPPGEWRW